jgi:hypothetical protein
MADRSAGLRFVSLILDGAATGRGRYHPKIARIGNACDPDLQ